MADEKISAMTAATSVADADLFTIVQGGANKKVTKANLGFATSEELAVIGNNLALNTLRDVVNAGWSITEMIDGRADEYNDETGIDTGAALNATYDAAGDYYEPSPASVDDFIIHADGTDASTVFTDDTGNHTIVTNGDAQVDTAQSQFGGASCLLDGTGDYLSIADSAAFDVGSGDFTADFWIRPSNVSGIKELFAFPDGGSGTGWTAVGQTGTNLFFAGTDDGTGFDYNVNASGITLAVNTWYHIAWVRNGDNIRVYVDGVNKIDTTLSASFSFWNTTGNLAIGARSNGTRPFAGHIDEVRFIKGTAVWTADFTSPTVAYVSGATNMTLPSVAFTANTEATNARVVVLYEAIDSSVLNTDFFADVSRDNGTTWTTYALTYEADFNSTIQVLTSDDLDISGQPSGTSMKYRFRTANEKEQRAHGVYIQWR